MEEQQKKASRIRINYPISITLHGKLRKLYAEQGGKAAFGSQSAFYAYVMGEFLSLREMLNPVAEPTSTES